MNKKVIYFFSGTGNCLKVAKTIASEIGDCDVISMGINSKHAQDVIYEQIGFVFPVYCAGLPIRVEKFAENMELSLSKDAYYFAIATYGGTKVNDLVKLNSILKEKGTKLSYHAKLRMAANYVALYKMNEGTEAVNNKAYEKLTNIISDIKNKTNNELKNSNVAISTFHSLMMKGLSNKDKGFNVSDACVSCGICKSVCPVENIEIKEKKPTFEHHCEQCMACIQWCPKEAINYKNKTQTRGRFRNSDITSQELASYYKK